MPTPAMPIGSTQFEQVVRAALTASYSVCAHRLQPTSCKPGARTQANDDHDDACTNGVSPSPKPQVGAVVPSQAGQTEHNYDCSPIPRLRAPRVQSSSVPGVWYIAVDDGVPASTGKGSHGV